MTVQKEKTCSCHTMIRDTARTALDVALWVSIHTVISLSQRLRDSRS